jgi:hypothetical protein
MPPSASGCWRVATRVTGETCVYLSVRNSSEVVGGAGVGGGGGMGGGTDFLLIIENIMEHGSWIVSHAQKEIQRPHIKKFGPK